MGQFRSLYQAEARRLLWLIGTVFAVVFVVQYFELPYGAVVSSLFSVGIPAPGNTSLPSSDSSSKFGTMDSMTVTAVQGLNSSDAHAMHGIGNHTPESNNEGRKDDFAFVMDETLDKSFDLDGDSNLGDDYSSENILERSENLTVEKANNLGTGSEPQNASKHESSLFLENVPADSLFGDIQKDEVTLPSERNTRSDVGLTSPFPASQIISASNPTSLTNLNPSPITFPPDRSSVKKGAAHTLNKDEQLDTSRNDLPSSDHNSSTSIPAVKIRPEFPAVTTIADMNNLLLQSRASSHSMVWMELPSTFSLEGIELNTRNHFY